MIRNQIFNPQWSSGHDSILSIDSSVETPFVQAVSLVSHPIANISIRVRFRVGEQYLFVLSFLLHYLQFH